MQTSERARVSLLDKSNVRWMVELVGGTEVEVAEHTTAVCWWRDVRIVLVELDVELRHWVIGTLNCRYAVILSARSFLHERQEKQQVRPSAHVVPMS